LKSILYYNFKYKLKNKILILIEIKFLIELNQILLILAMFLMSTEFLVDINFNSLNPNDYEKIFNNLINLTNLV
jgi:hypothetical protein